MTKKVDFTKETRKKVFIIAEISANHDHQKKRALRLIEIAKACGADAVKFQTYTPDTLTIDMDSAPFVVKHHKWGGETLHSLYKKAYMPWDWFPDLKKKADKMGIILLSSVFDRTSVDFMEKIGVPAHKISSYELVDLPLIEYVASKNKPLIMSTGMATLKEIEEAVSAARRAGVKDLILLKCVSSYPALPEDMNLAAMTDMKKRFNTAVGFSDHSLEIGASIAAVAMGATMIEKHITISRKEKTPDNFFSMEPDEFAEMVKNIRIAEKAIGRVVYGPSASEKEGLHIRRSLFVVQDIKKGEPITENNVRSIRPAAGIKPKYLKTILNKRAKTDIKKGTPLRHEFI